MSDFEVATIFNQVERRARKDHRCDDCNLSHIKPGDTYTETRMLYEGSWDTMKTCARCERVRKHADMDDLPYGKRCGYVREAIVERTYWRHRSRWCR